jgi:hypothetical protein
MAHVTALAAARHAVLARHGWDAEAKGLQGAPVVRVLANVHYHSSVTRPWSSAAAINAAAVNASGEAFMSGGTWDGQRVMRISVCGWNTNSVVCRTQHGGAGWSSAPPHRRTSIINRRLIPIDYR